MREDLIERLNRAAKTFGDSQAGLLYAEAAAALEAAREDGARLDALESLVSESDGMLLLHHGSGVGRGITGLGLRNTNRTLRQAIDQARGKGVADA